MYTEREWQLIHHLDTPKRVGDWLRRLPYNWEKRGETLRSFREVVRRGTAHCLEAALTAAVILEQHRFPPLVVSFESQDGIDHVIFVFRRRGRWGAVARSRDAGLHGRKPVFRTIRNLIWSYYDPYVDWTGRLTGYQLVDLRTLGNYNWRFNPKNMWKVEQFLLGIPHRRLKSSNARYKKLLREFLEFRKHHPKAPAEYYEGREHWL